MSIEETPKRKTHTSNEVKKKYNDKTYALYSVKFRKIEDADIIKLIGDEKAKGFSTSQAFKNLIRANA